MLPTSCNMEVNFFPGDNKYIMGDQISDVDCAAFGVIGSIYWASPSTDRGNALLKGTGSQTYCFVKKCSLLVSILICFIRNTT